MRKIGLFCAAAILLVACNEDKLTNVLTGASNFFAVRMTPEATTLAVGQTQQMTVTAYDGTGCNTLCTQSVPGNPITVTGTPRFKSLDTLKVKVDSLTGVATAVATGSTSVIARLQDIPGFSGAPSVTLADTTPVTVIAAASAFTLGGMTLTSSRATAGVGSTDTLTVTLTNSSGATIETQRAATITGTTTGRPQFYSSNVTVATVGTTGIVTGVTPGTVTISATITVSGVTKTATFNVTITDPITATFTIQQAISGTDFIFFPGILTVSVTEAVVEGKTGAVVTWTVPNTPANPGFTATSTPNSTTCFNVTFANPGAALAVGTGASGNLGVMCNGATQSRTFTTPGTYTFTNSTNSASGTLIVK